MSKIFLLRRRANSISRRHLIPVTRSDDACWNTEMGWGRPMPSGERNPTKTSSRFPCSMMLPTWLTTITWVWHWKPFCRCLWYIPACPQRLMNFVVFILVYARGQWTMSLWPNFARFHYTRPRTCCNVPHNGLCILLCIPVCPGVSVQMIRCFSITWCRAICIAIPYSSQRSHLPEAI